MKESGNFPRTRFSGNGCRVQVDLWGEKSRRHSRGVEFTAGGLSVKKNGGAILSEGLKTFFSSMDSCVDFLAILLIQERLNNRKGTKEK